MMTNVVEQCCPCKPNRLEPIEIVVVKKGSSIRPGFQRAYIGRGTPLGNPFSHLEHSKAEIVVGSRGEAVDAYGEWFSTRQFEVVKWGDRELRYFSHEITQSPRSS